MANLYGPRIVTDGLVLHLDAGNRKSYPGSGSTWYDLSGQGNHVTKDATYSPTFNSNGYFTFGGDGDNFETQSANIALGSQITMICWYNQTGSGVGSPRVLETLISGGTIPYTNALAVNTDGVLRGWIDTTTTTSARIEERVSSASFFQNTWRMFTYTYSGSSTSSKIYVNDLVASTTIYGNSGSTTSIDDVGVITIGAISDINTYTHNQHAFQGHIAICQLYTKALSADEISRNYNALKGRFGL